MKYIQLNKGLYAQVDDEDFEYLNQWKWSKYNSGPNNKTPYARRTMDGKQISMHRFIMNIHNVCDRNVVVDHIDGDGLNNQRHNLRIATRSQNGANRSKKKNGTSKYLGVTKVANRISCYRAQITKDGKCMKLGNFKDEESAALAYNIKAIELHGEFANINIINHSSVRVKNNSK